MGAKFAYVQSDEISILLTDFEDIGTQAWFENNVQKMVSVAASMATAKFNQLRMMRATSTYLIDNKGDSHKSLNLEDIQNFKLAEFDARVYQIPQKVEVENYLIWRQQDATRNSISSVAQSLYSHKELHGVSSDQHLPHGIRRSRGGRPVPDPPRRRDAPAAQSPRTMSGGIQSPSRSAARGW
jgi:tRNA(His) 5'-end guanylyltransferase